MFQSLHNLSFYDSNHKATINMQSSQLNALYKQQIAHAKRTH